MADNEEPRDLQAEAQAKIPRIERAFKFAQPHRVRHDEIDAQGIVGNATWLQLLQLGRVEYLRNLGLISLEGGNAPVQAVVRTAAVEYLAPARFDDALLIRVRASYLGFKSTRFEFLADNADTDLRHVVAETVVVCVNMQTFQSSPWPQVWRERIAELEGADLRQQQQT
jgi:acyl-CoA thioester hydrolase